MMGAYSAIPLDASSNGAESATATAAVPDSATGESTSIASESAAAAPDGTAGTGEPAPPYATAPRERTVATTLARGFGWLFFVGGLVGAVLGIAGLHVEITVAGLILACTAGLILLKLRSDSVVREPEA